MNQNHFAKQMQRLNETFGGYKQERAELIWKEVIHLSDKWLTDTVDEFIGSCRQPPLLTEFRDKKSIEVERVYKIEKQKHTSDAEEFMSSFSGEDIRMICENIRKIYKGLLTENEKRCQLSLLNSVLTTTQESESKESSSVQTAEMD